MLKNDFFGLNKVKWLHLIGAVKKCVRFLCQIFSGFKIPKIIKIGQFLTELFRKLKVGRFGGTHQSTYNTTTILGTDCVNNRPTQVILLIWRIFHR